MNKAWCWLLLGAALLTEAVVPAGATSLRRAGLDELVAGNRWVVVGEVLDARSYWNQDGTFILTDVRVAIHETLKGVTRDREIDLTLLGGTVGDLTTLILGGAELIPGRSYVLFLNQEDLQGAPGVRTVRDHAQGVFEISIARDGLRAYSQARREPLVADPTGEVTAPGGAQGLLLTDMMRSIRELASRPTAGRKEVQ